MKRLSDTNDTLSPIVEATGKKNDRTSQNGRFHSPHLE